MEKNNGRCMSWCNNYNFFAILFFDEIVTEYGFRLITPTAGCKFSSNRIIEEIRHKLFFFSNKIEVSVDSYVNLQLI